MDAVFENTAAPSPTMKLVVATLIEDAAGHVERLDALLIVDSSVKSRLSTCKEDLHSFGAVVQEEGRAITTGIPF
jgi:hypothetical protein